MDPGDNSRLLRNALLLPPVALILFVVGLECADLLGANRNVHSGSPALFMGGLLAWCKATPVVEGIALAWVVLKAQDMAWWRRPWNVFCAVAGTLALLFSLFVGMFFLWHAGP